VLPIFFQKEINNMVTIHQTASKNKEKVKNTKISHPISIHLSKAAMQVAKNNLKAFESQSDEAFLIRAEINRKLRTL